MRSKRTYAWYEVAPPPQFCGRLWGMDWWYGRADRGNDSYSQQFKRVVSKKQVMTLLRAAPVGASAVWIPNLDTAPFVLRRDVTARGIRRTRIRNRYRDILRQQGRDKATDWVWFHGDMFALPPPHNRHKRA